MIEDFGDLVNIFLDVYMYIGVNKITIKWLLGKVLGRSFGV